MPARATKGDESRGIRVEACHLKRFSNKHTMLLNDVTFVVPSNSFVCIVGRSGTGKTTLVEVLNGLRPAHQGCVFYDGQDYYRHLASFNTQIGYVPQEDTVHRDLAVERALYYAAKLRLAGKLSETQTWQRVDEVMEDMGIAHRRKLLIGKLSGGQRKRVSIAMELLAHPRIFFLDEPTSGLDPDMDRKMMGLLRRLADRGHTIIMTTHATANIKVCDYVCFLAEGGRLAYFGPPAEALIFFDKADFAEIYATLEPTSEDPYVPEEAATLFKASPDYQKYVLGLFGQARTGHTVPQTASIKGPPLEQGNRKGPPTTPLHPLPLHFGPLRTIGRFFGKLTPVGAGTSRPMTTMKQLKQRYPWSQFLLLTMRSLELLGNNMTNLLILLLQAPLIGLILMLLVKYEIGTPVFDASSIASCPTTSQILTAAGLIDTPGTLNPPVSLSCDRVASFLKHDPRGKVYATHRGGAQRAMQDFIAAGSGADAQKVLFIMAFVAVMFGSTNAIREIVKEGPIYQRERTVNLGILPYMSSKMVVSVILCLFQTGVLVVMVASVAPFHESIFLPAYLEVYITLVLAALAGAMLGLAISAAVPNNDTALSFIPIVLAPQVVFSGTIFPLKDLFSQCLGALFAARWAMIALGSSVGLHSDRLVGDKLFGNDYTYHGVLFSTYSHQDAMHHLLLIWSALLLMMIVLAIALGLFLKRKDVHR
jgi:ABC-type multidrug transport system ATPase subunit/ABC-type multidrug transport system permease subunit